MGLASESPRQAILPQLNLSPEPASALFSSPQLSPRHLGYLLVTTVFSSAPRHSPSTAISLLGLSLAPRQSLSSASPSLHGSLSPWPLPLSTALSLSSASPSPRHLSLLGFSPSPRHYLSSALLLSPRPSFLPFSRPRRSFPNLFLHGKTPPNLSPWSPPSNPAANLTTKPTPRHNQNSSGKLPRPRLHDQTRPNPKLT